MLCSSPISQLSSAEAGEQEAPWNFPMLHSSPQHLGLRGRSRWVHSLEQEVCREESHGLSDQGLNCLWLQLPNFMSAPL